MEKTELEFPYSPADFFEAQYRRQTDEYVLVADGGGGENYAPHAE